MKKILLSLLIVCTLFACSDKEEIINPEALMRMELLSIARTNLSSQKLVFDQCSQIQTLTNPRDEEVILFDLDRYIEFTGAFNGIYNSSVYYEPNEPNYPNYPAIKQYFLPYQSNNVQLTVEKYTIFPAATTTPYTFMAFLTQQEWNDIENILNDALPEGTIIPTKETILKIMPEILEKIRPYVVVYKYSIDENVLNMCMDKNGEQNINNLGEN